MSKCSTAWPANVAHPQLRPKLALKIILATLLLLMPAGPAQAGTHPRSSWSNGTFNLVVSLDFTPTDPQKVNLSDGFNLFAKDVWRMTEGHHRIGTIYVYTPVAGKARYWNTADIIMKNGGPGEADASISGFRRAGGRIYVRDNIADINEIGHTLGHELGHYAYGLFDEYAENQGTDPDNPHADDNAKQTLMSDHRNYWQFSLLQDYAVDERKTAHWRMYESSCWQTLVRDPKLDPTGTKYSMYIKAGMARHTYADLIALKTEPTLAQPVNYPALTIVYDPVADLAADAGARPDEISPETGRIVTIEDSDSDFNLSAEISGGIYPDPLVIRATIHRDQYLTGLNVTARLTSPLGTDTFLTLADDGLSPDEEAGDGVYTGAVIDYVNGTYQIEVEADNLAGTAVETTKGLFVKRGTFPVPIPVPDAIQLQARGTITCGGVVDDSDGTSFADAIWLPTDGSLIPGRLETNGDVDYFYFVATGTEALSIFTTELFPAGLRTQLTLYDTYQRPIASPNLAQADDGTDYRISFVPTTPGLYYLTVEHASAGDGIYHLVARPDQPTTVMGDGSGNTIGACFVSSILE